MLWSFTTLPVHVSVYSALGQQTVNWTVVPVTGYVPVPIWVSEGKVTWTLPAAREPAKMMFPHVE